MAEKNNSGESSSAKAIAYVKIAKGLHGLGETALAMEVCESGIKKLPESASTHIAKAEILIARFNAEGKGELVKTALVSLETALKLDPHNYLAKLLASQIYLKAKKVGRAKELLTEILKTSPDDEKAGVLMAMITEKEKAAEEARLAVEREADESRKKAEQAAEEAKKAENEKKAEEEARKAEQAALSAEGGEEDGGVVVVGGKQVGDADAKMGDTKPESVQWVLDDKVVIGAQEESDDEMAHENLSAKLTLFSRLDGLLGIFLLDKNGQPFKVLNKAKLNENVFPSLVFNILKASMNGVRRSGLGSFQRGTLVTPIGTIIVANVFYATLAVVVGEDANMTVVETRIQRYLSEVA
ncbi:MAG: tetratricopeptide repeat protein [Nitrospinae bacterium]|nr:tetratricopeptide repeat protein [Nitrospinota bacterium]